MQVHTSVLQVLRKFDSMIGETLTEEMKTSGVNLISNCGVC